jgi:hypothetical protein
MFYLKSRSKLRLFNQIPPAPKPSLFFSVTSVVDHRWFISSIWSDLWWIVTLSQTPNKESIFWLFYFNDQKNFRNNIVDGSHLTFLTWFFKSSTTAINISLFYYYSWTFRSWADKNRMQSFALRCECRVPWHKRFAWMYLPTKLHRRSLQLMPSWMCPKHWLPTWSHLRPQSLRESLHWRLR